MTENDVAARISALHLPMEQIAELCRRYQISELCLFGSALRDDFRPDSDLDFLVDFPPDADVDIFDLVNFQVDMEDLLGRKVDIVPREGIKPLIREAVIKSARTLYAAG